MIRRRDPTRGTLSDDAQCLDVCKEGTCFDQHAPRTVWILVYAMRTIAGHQLTNSISRFNEHYFCTVEKLLIWPSKIRVYIDERGDNSLGLLTTKA